MLLTTQLQRAFLGWRDEHTAVSAALDRTTPPLRNLLLQSRAHLQVRLRCWGKREPDETEKDTDALFVEHSFRISLAERFWRFHLKLRFRIRMKNVTVKEGFPFESGSS